MSSRAQFIATIVEIAATSVSAQQPNGPVPPRQRVASTPLSVSIPPSADAAKPEVVPGVSTSRSVILVPNDDTIAPFGRPLNLTGKSVDFVRTSPESFSASTGPLALDADRGSKLTLDPKTLIGTYTISGFDLPFFSTSTRTLHVSRLLAIYLEPPPASPGPRQNNDAELLLRTTPVIARPSRYAIRTIVR